MEKTWRWFGKKDKITLQMLRQIGVEGIVTALHDVPNGEIWTLEAIEDLKQYIESYGLRWSVVESLPVCEAIKYAGPEREQLIENYKISLANLGKAGVKTVCYNFMPVIDWIRTDLYHPWPDGSSSLYFDYARFAYFDVKILQILNGNVAHVLMLNVSVLVTVSVVEKVVLVRVFQDGSAPVQNLCGVFSRKLHIIVSIQTCITLFKTNNLTAIFINCSKCYSSYNSIKTRTISTTC